MLKILKSGCSCGLCQRKRVRKALKIFEINDEDARMKNVDFTESSGNVFVDLGFEPDEAAVMLIRVEVAIHISRRIKEKDWTLDEVARQLSVTLPQASQLAK